MNIQYLIMRQPDYAIGHCEVLVEW